MGWQDDQVIEKASSGGGWREDEVISKPKPEARPSATARDRATALGAGAQRGMVAGLMGLPVDTAQNIANLGIAAFGALSPKEGTPLPQGGTAGAPPEPLQGSVGSSEWIADKLRGAGATVDNPRPDDPSSRMLFTGGNIAGASALPGAGAGNTLAAATSGAIAGEVLGPQWVGPAAMAPGAITQAASAAKASIANPQTVRENVETFKQAGTRPDVAQATESNFLRGLTNVIGRFPGGQGIISKFRETEQEALGATARTGTTAEAGGRAIKEGISGDGGFLDRTKAQWVKLDDELAAKVGDRTFAPANTVSALDSLTKLAPGAEKTTASLVNPKIAEIKANLNADLQANNGVIPFDSLRALRSKVGSMLDDSLVSGVPNGELKRLYGGLSKDLEASAKEAGAGPEFARQSNYYRARMDRIENTLDSVLGNGKTFEQIFKGVAPTDIDSVNKIRQVYRSLEPDQRQVVSEAIVNRMGRATPGKQDATGEKFSSETFLSNWSRINDSAKAQLFPDSATRNRLDAIAKVSSEIRDSGKPFANSSGTSQGLSAAGVYSTVPAAATLAATGHPGTAASVVLGAGALVAGANIGAKMLTSPGVVDWLAKSAKVSTPEQMTAQMGRLSVIYNQTKDQKLRGELSQYINSVGGNQ